PSASALGSIGSRASCPTLFADFSATMAESDFSGPFIIGDGSSPSRCGPATACHPGQSRDLPVPLTRRLAGSHHKLAGRANSLGVARDLLCLEHQNRTC